MSRLLWTFLLCLNLMAFAVFAQTPAPPPVGWRLAGASVNEYELTTVQDDKHGGTASANLRLVAKEPQDIDDSVYAVQSFKADAYRGKRVRLTGWMKTEKVDGASFLFRVNGRTGLLALDFMEKTAPLGTTPWTKYTLVLDVPEKGQGMAVFFILTGRGQLWVDDLQLDVVGADVPVTDYLTADYRKQMDAAEVEAEKKENGKVPPAVAALPDKPANLDFESPSTSPTSK